jgi:hypothetical protein
LKNARPPKRYGRLAIEDFAERTGRRLVSSPKFMMADKPRRPVAQMAGDALLS